MNIQLLKYESISCSDIAHKPSRFLHGHDTPEPTALVTKYKVQQFILMLQSIH